jgi:hypothetical protein
MRITDTDYGLRFFSTKEGPIMQYRTETKLQSWRALAVFEDGSECLIFLGRSTTQVRGGYATAFTEILEPDERARVQSISMQCWDGAPDEGRWVTKTTLNIPLRTATEAAIIDDEEEEAKPRILAFRPRFGDLKKAIAT